MCKVQKGNNHARNNRKTANGVIGVNECRKSGKLDDQLRNGLEQEFDNDSLRPAVILDVLGSQFSGVGVAQRYPNGSCLLWIALGALLGEHRQTC